MFCVIQQIEKKKLDAYGHQKEIEAYKIEINGIAKYCYRYSGGRFERPHNEAYRISIHHSFRENSNVKKRQFCVTTMSYYDFVDFSFYDCHKIGRVEDIAESLSVDAQIIYDLIYAKIDPLQERIRAEFKKTPEYKTKAKHDRIIRKYNKAKSSFAYGSDEYDYCYNVFGELMNPDYLAELEKRSYEEARHSNYSGSYQRTASSNYSALSSYSAEEKDFLKQFYRALSAKFHPDVNARDTTKGLIS